MDNSITDIPGLLIGHATNIEAATGCTVILSENGAVTAVDIRGGAPGTREIPALDTVNYIQKAHAVYLGGGSAFGLSGASGVMRYLEERKIGLDVGVTVIPIVPGAVLYDLQVGRADVRPDMEMGYAACTNACSPNTEQGNVGAGTGATIGKAAGMKNVMKGGIGTASCVTGDLIVGAIVAVNCFGDIIDPDSGKIIAGMLNEDGKSFTDTMKMICETDTKLIEVFKGGNTTIGLIATNAILTKTQAKKVAMMGHDGYARVINPIHTLYDGDSIFCMAMGEIEADLTSVGSIAAKVMAEAVVNGVKASGTAYGIPGYRDITQ